MVGMILYSFCLDDDYLHLRIQCRYFPWTIGNAKLRELRNRESNQACTNDNGNQPCIGLQITNPSQLPNAHLSFLALFGVRRMRNRCRVRLPSRDSLRRDDRCPRHWGKLHRLKCRLLGKLHIAVQIGMRGCNPFTILIQKNHGSMVRVVAVGRGVGVSAFYIS